MKQNGYVKAVKAAFPYTIPVLTGYLFIGIAFGVMYQEKGYNFLWAILMSILVYAGSGQYLAVNFFAPGVSFLQIIFLEFMVNIRHVFYGLSLIEKFRDMGKKKLYMIFSLTDETYSLFFITKITTNNAVMAKSIPVVSNGISVPAMAPMAEPIIQ